MRITVKDLEAVCERINRTAGVVPESESPLWERRYEPGDPPTGTLVQRKGVYHLSGAYGGYSLHLSSGPNGGVSDVFRCGHIPKRELYDRMQAFLDGMAATDSTR
jgi:hypothetical protein